jgi:hypothetical protein
VDDLPGVTLRLRHAVLGALVASACAAPAASARPFVPAPGSPIAVGQFPTMVAAGHLDADATTDLAAVNVLGSSMSVLLGTGTGGFANAPGSPVVASLSRPVSLAFADFDADGHQDVVAGNSFLGQVSVLLGDGAGGFADAPGSPIAGFANPYTVGTADFDGDGDQDIAVAAETDELVTVLLNDGSAAFTTAPGSPVSSGSRPEGMAIADVDGDGNADIAITNQSAAQVTVLLGDGAGGLTPAAGSPVPTGAQPYGIVTADFNRDAAPDLAVANSGDGTVSVLLGDGSGGFTPAPGSPLAGFSGAIGLAAADLDGDAAPDLAVANSAANTVSVLLGDGTGAFAPQTGSPYTVGAAPRSVAIGDFDGDAAPDLAVTNGFDNTVTVLLQPGPAPTPPAPTPVPEPAPAPAAAPIAQRPFVTALSPAHGPVAGGVTVHIAGENLDGVTGVWFGDTPATAFTVDRFDAITATVPAHAAGTVAVRVHSAGGESPVVEGAAYTYEAPAPAALPAAAQPHPVPTPRRRSHRPARARGGRHKHRGHHRHARVRPRRAGHRTSSHR